MRHGLTIRICVRNVAAANDVVFAFSETGGVEVAVHRQPPRPGVSEENQWDDHKVCCERPCQPLVADLCTEMQAHVHHGHRQCDETIVDVGGTEKIARSPFVSQMTVRTGRMHDEPVSKEMPLTTTRTSEPEGT